MCVKWYRKWHQKWYSHHVHTAILGIYVFTVIFSLVLNLLPGLAGLKIPQVQAATNNYVWGSGGNAAFTTATTNTNVDFTTTPNAVQLAASSSFAPQGTGADGPLTVSGGTTFNLNVNTNAYNSRSYPDGVNWQATNSISGTGSKIFTGGTVPGGFAIGDQILVINLKGTSLAYSSTGSYEFTTITGTTSTSITASLSANNTYDGTTQKIMIQRVPQYTNVTVSTNSTSSASVLTANAWNGSMGGVVAFRATGTVSITAPGNNILGFPTGIVADSLGYRGGTRGSTSGTNAFSGESYNGGFVASGGMNSSAGIASQGGGGGGGVNSSTTYTGGAGALGTGGGGTGACYELNSAYISESYGGGGGYGGVGSAGTGASSGSGANGGSGGNGVYNSTTCYPGNGGGGGTVGNSSQLNSIAYFGGGGGGTGAQNQQGSQTVGSTGGVGGGIVFIGANQVNVGAYTTITSAGQKEQNISTGYGGAGAGGSIIINAKTFSNTGAVTANGGTSIHNTTGGGGRTYLQYGSKSGNAISPNYAETFVASYSPSGTLGAVSDTGTSLLYDAGSGLAVKPSSLNWTSTTGATGQKVLFKVRSASSTAGLATATCYGPTASDATCADWSTTDGTAFSQYNTSGTVTKNPASLPGAILNTIPANRYAEILVNLVSDGTNTPILTNLTLAYDTLEAPANGNITLTKTDSTGLKDSSGNTITGGVAGAYVNATTLRVTTSGLTCTGCAVSPTNLRPAVEIKAVGSAFTNTATNTATAGNSYVDLTGLSAGTSYHLQVEAVDDQGRVSAWTAYGGNADPNGADVTVDTTAPTGGSITYTDGIYNTASVALTSAAGTDAASGVNTASRTVQRRSATFAAGGGCNTFGSYGTISTSGTYPNLTDTGVVIGNCYQYQYLVSDNAGNQATYTGANTARIGIGSPTIGTTTVSIDGPTVNWTEPTTTTGVTYTINRYLGSGTLDVAAVKSGLTPGTTSWQDTSTNDQTHTPLGNTAYKYTVTTITTTESSESSQSNAVTTYSGVPTMGTLTADSNSQITVNWTAPSGGATSYKIYRADVGSGNTPIATGITATIWTDNATNDSSNPLAVNAQYTYTVSAVTGSGEGYKSSSASRYTLANAPGTPTAAVHTNTTIQITVSQNSNPVGTKFAIHEATGNKYVQADGSLNSTPVWQTYAQWGGSSGITVNGLVANHQYTFEVKAQNGDSAPSAFSPTVSNYTLNDTITLDTPATPTNSNKPSISNSASPDANLANITIRLYEKTAGPTYSLRATRSANANGVFTFSGTDYSTVLTPDGSHDLVARALNGEGAEGLDSDIASVYLDTSAPNTPGSFSVTVNSSTSIVLRWTVSSDSDGSPVYMIQRGPSATGPWSTVKDNLAISTTSWVDNAANDPSNTPQANTLYYYQMKAYDNVANASAWTTALPATTVPGAPSGLSVNGPTLSSLSLSWTAPSGTGTVTYNIHRSTDNSSWSTVKTGVSTTTWVDNDVNDSDNLLLTNTQYYYQVSAVSSGGEGANSDSASKYTLTNAPGLITAVVASNTEIDLNWTAATGGVAYYHLYRLQGVNVTQVGGDIASGTLSFQDTGLSANTSYNYKVYGVNGDSPKAESATYATVSKYTLNDTPVIDTPATPVNNTRPAINNANHANSSFATKNAYLYDNGSLIATVAANGSGVFAFNTVSYGANSLADGNHNHLAVKVDNSDNPAVMSAASAAVTVFVDTAAPSTNLATGPASADGSNGYFVTNPSFTLTVNDPAPSGGNGTTFWRWNSDSYQAYTGPISNMAQGAQTLWWYTTDSAGNTEAAHSQQYKLDTIAPTGTLAFADGPYSHLNPTVLNLSSADVTSGVGGMQFSNSGNPLEFCDASGTLGTWENVGATKTWNFTNATCGGTSGDGSKTVYVRFKDNAGNISSPFSSTSTLDTVPPANTTQVQGFSTSSSSSADLSSSDWNHYATPKFSWNGASDASPGSGIKGYWVYFGTDSGASPVTTTSGNLVNADTESNFISGNSYTVGQNLESGKTYYLLIQSQDNALNFADSSFDENANKFVYKYDSTQPIVVSAVSPTPSGWSTTDSYSFSWGAASDPLVNGASSGVAKYQYKVDSGGDSWHDTQSTMVSNITHYSAGANIFVVQVIDRAGNISGTTQAVYYYSGAVSQPQHLVPDLSQSQGGTVNLVGFSWDPPANTNASGYYYSKGAAPTLGNSTLLDLSDLPSGVHLSGSHVTLDPIQAATETGQNHFYVVCKDEFGNVGWATPAEADFTITTQAPTAPSAVTITDASSRSASMYALTAMWPTVANPTPDFAGYQVERSTDGAVFNPVATVKTNIYSEAGLTEGQTYYFRIRSIDNTGNTSSTYVQSSRIPTGKYTVPPVLTKEPEASVKATSVTIEWDTDRVSNSIVQFGPGNGYGQEISQATTYVFDHSITLAGLTPGLKYHYRVASIDKDYDYSEDSAFSKDYSFTTLQAPGISNVTTSEIRLYSAIVTWKTTSSATSRVLYGTSSQYGSTYEDSSGSQTTTHTVKLDKLTDSMTYHYKIQGLDVDGNILNSDDYVFTTLTFPKLSDLKVEHIVNSRPSTTRVAFDSNVPTSASVNFSGAGGKDVSSYTLDTKHQLLVTGLSDDSTYSVTAKGRDEYGNESLASSVSFTTPYDTTPPLITDITVETSIIGYGIDAKGQVVISWTTDKLSSSQVEYGSGVGGDSYTSKTQEDSSLTETHVVIISDLKPSSPYHFRVVSRDKAGNSGMSGDNSVLTQQASESVLDLIIKSLQSSIGWIFSAFKGGASG